MHENQLDVDEDLARRLIAAQFPSLAALPVRRVRTAGTVNTIMRIGEDLVARFPLQATAPAELVAVAAALTEFSSASAFPSPQPFGAGEATAEYPSAWSVQTWVPGEVARPDRHASSASLAEDVATLVTSLRRLDPGGRVFDGRGRGGSLRDHDEWMVHCFAQSAHLIDVPHAERLWAVLHDLPRSGSDVMSHRDLTPPNLLVSDSTGADRLAGVLDGGAFGPTDPGLDLVAAWHLFDGPARRVVRERVGAGNTEWFRGAAWALQQAMGLVWYYEESNPEMSALGLSTLRRLLEDAELGALVV
ncbi:phosphotransferase [Microbacterium sp. LWH12-1.2]|uniref:phosphotransferase n=1 Tax=Microbacterium sp. LWH12-1.2 TaxID=3135259 RepID=UPI00342683D7